MSEESWENDWARIQVRKKKAWMTCVGIMHIHLQGLLGYEFYLAPGDDPMDLLAKASETCKTIAACRTMEDLKAAGSTPRDEVRELEEVWNKPASVRILEAMKAKGWRLVVASQMIEAMALVGPDESDYGVGEDAIEEEVSNRAGSVHVDDVRRCLASGWSPESLLYGNHGFDAVAGIALDVFSTKPDSKEGDAA